MTSAKDWDSIKVFNSIYDKKNIDASAKDLKLSRSTVSRQLQKLEQNLNTTLFDRTQSGLVPTDLAVKLYQAAQDAEIAINVFYELALTRTTEISGKVKISSMPQLIQDVLLPALPDFLCQHKSLEIEFVDESQTPNLARRDSHLSVRLSRKDFDNLIVKKISELSYGIYASDHLHVDESIPIYHQPWLTYDDSLSHSPDSIWLKQNLENVHARIKAKQRSTLLAAADQGLGLCLSPNVFAKKYKGLKRVYKDIGNLPKAPLWLCCDRQYRYLPKIDAVWNFLVEVGAEL